VFDRCRVERPDLMQSTRPRGVLAACTPDSRRAPLQLLPSPAADGRVDRRREVFRCLAAWLNRVLEPRPPPAACGRRRTLSIHPGETLALAANRGAANRQRDDRASTRRRGVIRFEGIDTER